MKCEGKADWEMLLNIIDTSNEKLVKHKGWNTEMIAKVVGLIFLQFNKERVHKTLISFIEKVVT